MLLLGCLWVFAAGCIDGRSRPPEGGVLDGRPAEGGGPGPLGALPTGYCCTSDQQCRDRRCVDHGGGRMCVDRCNNDAECAVAVQGFSCVPQAALPSGMPARRCAPLKVSTPCRPSNGFVPGIKPFGSCCNTRLDCSSGHCGSAFSGPYLCLRTCQTYADCPSSYSCVPLDQMSNGKLLICIPSLKSYTCAP